MLNNMMRPKITFVTGNKNKLEEVRKIIGSHIQLVNNDADLPEYQGEPEFVATAKCKEAFKLIQSPVITEDTSLSFNAFQGLPGVYIKWFLNKLKPEGLFKMLEGFEDKSAIARCTFCLIQSANEEPLVFVGETKGQIVFPRGSTTFGWDPIFLPDGFDETY